MMPYRENEQFTRFKQQDMMRRADDYRLAQTARAGRRFVRFHFYYRALAGFGHWLIVSGYRLQKRYGQLSELSTPMQKPMPSKPRA
jgi:hypothetical protein